MMSAAIVVVVEKVLMKAAVVIRQAHQVVAWIVASTIAQNMKKAREIEM